MVLLSILAGLLALTLLVAWLKRLPGVSMELSRHTRRIRSEQWRQYALITRSANRESSVWSTSRLMVGPAATVQNGRGNGATPRDVAAMGSEPSPWRCRLTARML